MEHEEYKSKEEPESVPYYIYEGAVVRGERYFKRAIIALVLVTLVSILYAYMINRAWMIHVEKNYIPIERSVEGESVDG